MSSSFSVDEDVKFSGEESAALSHSSTTTNNNNLADNPSEAPNTNNLTDNPSAAPVNNNLADNPSEAPVNNNLADNPSEAPVNNNLADNPSEAPVNNNLADNHSEASTTDEPTCAICLGDIVNKSITNTCKHEFCFTCLSEWIKTKRECPLCRGPFVYIHYNFRSETDFDKQMVFVSGRDDLRGLSTDPIFRAVAEYRGPRTPQAVREYLQAIFPQGFNTEQ